MLSVNAMQLCEEIELELRESGNPTVNEEVELIHELGFLDAVMFLSRAGGG